MIVMMIIDHTNAPWLSTLESRYLHDGHDDDDDDEGGDDGDDDDDDGGNDDDYKLYDCKDDHRSY